MDVSPSQLLEQYGYLAVFAGSLLEGETILLLAGFAVHQGYLAVGLVVACGVCGGTLGDMIFFLIGRRYGSALLTRFPRFAPRIERFNSLLRRYHGPAIILVRFLYGLRIAGPMAIGAGGISAWRFLFFNVLGAALWAGLLTGVGYLFGHTLDLMMGDLKRYEEAAFGVLAACALCLGFWRWRRNRRAG
ncbi:MAG: DedA family [Desulfovibrionaceae bacterium]|nr:MAG: DedA family [Desulfovibrionaceae bacterium]